MTDKEGRSPLRKERSVMRDTTPRYTPDTILTANGIFTVLQRVFHPPGKHPSESPIKSEVGCVALTTIGGTRWYGCDKGWINSELRMVVSGFPAKFEEMSNWEVCKDLT